VQVDLHSGVGRGEVGNDVGENGSAKVDGGGDAKKTGRLIVQFGEGVDDVAKGRKKRRYAAKQGGAGGAEGDMTGRAVDELDADGLLEGRDGSADRGLGDVEVAGGSGEAASLGDGDEDGEEVEVDCSHGGTLLCWEVSLRARVWAP